MRRCSICTSAARRRLDEALLRGTSIAELARKHGVSEDALGRHYRNHLQVSLQRHAQTAREEMRYGTRLAEQLHFISAKCEELLALAQSQGNLNAAIGCLKELREVSRLLALSTGELQEGNRTQVNIAIAKPLSREEAIQLAKDVLALYSGPDNALPAPGEAPTIEGEVNHAEQ